MKNYIPKNKSDIEVIGELVFYEPEAIRVDIPELLEWMQDGHWLVAHVLAAYFLPYVNEIKAELLYILNTNDDLWKQVIMSLLLKRATVKLAPELMPIIQRMANNPTQDEIDLNLDGIAKDIINKQLKYCEN